MIEHAKKVLNLQCSDLCVSPFDFRYVCEVLPLNITQFSFASYQMFPLHEFLLVHKIVSLEFSLIELRRIFFVFGVWSRLFGYL